MHIVYGTYANSIGISVVLVCDGSRNEVVWSDSADSPMVIMGLTKTITRRSAESKKRRAFYVIRQHTIEQRYCMVICARV